MFTADASNSFAGDGLPESGRAGPVGIDVLFRSRRRLWS